MTLYNVINEKKSYQSRIWYRALNILFKVIFVVVLVNPLMKGAIDAIVEKEFGNINIYLSLGVIIFMLLIMDFVLEKVEHRFIDRVRKEPEYRRKIIGEDNFIEGNWFVRTQNSELRDIEYAKVTIVFDHDNWQIRGELFVPKNSGGIANIGWFKSQVGQFFFDQRNYKYAYTRTSAYEEVAKIQNGISEGAGTYQFEVVDGELKELKGQYFDPVTNKVHLLRGYRIEELERREKLKEAGSELEQVKILIKRLKEKLNG